MYISQSMQQQKYLEMISIILSRKHFKLTLNLSFLMLLSIIHVLQLYSVTERVVSYFLRKCILMIHYVKEEKLQDYCKISTTNAGVLQLSSGQPASTCLPAFYFCVTTYLLTRPSAHSSAHSSDHPLTIYKPVFGIKKSNLCEPTLNKCMTYLGRYKYVHVYSSLIIDSIHILTIVTYNVTLPLHFTMTLSAN